MRCFPFFCSRRVESAGGTPEVDEEFFVIENIKLYGYKELRAVTDDFSPANKIGEGGFGPVYKGKLKNGKLAAIKVLSAESQQGINEFLAEIKAISEIQHENLVKLYGCCVEGRHRVLVYNYMENNSLAETLLGRHKCSIEFNWPMRSKICIGIARGLAFLHEEVRPHIVHRDIKASNILLDEDCTPKISDFGLAKLMPPNVTHVSTRVAGTLGYLAPEYAVRGQLTRRADVYSFGVLLAEIVCGRCNRNMRLPSEDRYLLEQIWEHYRRGELVVLVDESLGGVFDPEEACRILKVSLLCTQDAPKLRPAMSSVVKMLTGDIDVVEMEITAPGLISDLFDVKVQDPQNDKHSATTSYYDNSTFSGLDTMQNSTFVSGASADTTLALTAAYDQSV